MSDSDLIQAVATVIVALIVLFGNRGQSKASARVDLSNANAVDIETFQELVCKVGELSDELLKIKQELAEVKSALLTLRTRYKALWKFLIECINIMRRHGLRPPAPPSELLDEPELLELLKDE